MGQSGNSVILSEELLDNLGLLESQKVTDEVRTAEMAKRVKVIMKYWFDHKEF